MIPFLVVTSVLNIAVGYALAMYLGRGRLHVTTGESAADRETIELPGAAVQFPTPFVFESTRAEATVPKAMADANATAPRSSVEVPADSPYARSDVMEQELLAGIEEFRNQLSQLKGAGTPGVFLDPLTTK